MNDPSSFVAALPEPMRSAVLESLEQLKETAALQGVELRRLEALPGDTARVWACSEFVAQSCLRQPTLLVDLVDSGDLVRTYPEGQYPALLEKAFQSADTEAALSGMLRRIKRRELVRIAWRDIAGLAGYEETVRDTSAFADSVLDLTLERLYQWQIETRGTPVSAGGEPQRMVVLALGKLGASELNFSSDIDLIFTFPESGSTTGGNRSMSNEEFFVRLARRYVNVLSQTTEDGFVFRVDMRLRPFGESGRLVCSVSAMVDYYQIHGRDWERYALVRARPAAGDLRAGQELLERLRPFVFRRYIDFGALESLREMKMMVSAEVNRKSMQDNVKLGPGGIREVEFVCQAFQLVRGGRVPALRGRQIVAVLGELGRLEYLPLYAVDELVEAYRFLRSTEHRLQQHEEQQVHSLPREADSRARLAIGMGYSSWEAFAEQLERHRARVQSHFDQVFGTVDEQETDGDVLAAVWDAALDEEQIVETLKLAGFEQAAEVAETLATLRSSYAVRGLAERGRARMGRLMPALLRTVATRREPLTTLRRLVGIVEAIARRSVYMALLVERPLALAQLVKLCEASPLVARQFARYPLLLDELLDSRALYAPLQREELLADMQGRLKSVNEADVEQEMDALRQFKQSNVLRVAAADLTQAIDIDQVSERLTQIAEVALGGCLKLAWRDLCGRYGEPGCVVDGKEVAAPFAVVAYGKFGSQELSYSSDLDLVFMHGSRGEAQRTRGSEPVDNTVFFPRLAQRIIHYLSTHTGVGALYSIDTRLRPSGSDGLLVAGIDSFERYQLEQAWTWEHQALVRARVVAGDETLSRDFQSLRTRLLLLERDHAQLKRDVIEMRARMRRAHGSRNERSFDIKQDRGGIADIEFMVQYATLAWAPKLRKYIEFTDNLRLLSAIAELGLMGAEDVAVLSEVYREYRAWMHRLALAEKPAIVDASALEAQRRHVIAIWERLFGLDDTVLASGKS